MMVDAAGTRRANKRHVDRVLGLRVLREASHRRSGTALEGGETSTSSSFPEPENAGRLLLALQDFGFGAVDLTAADFTRPVTVALGRAPHQIDLMTFIKGATSRLPGRTTCLVTATGSRSTSSPGRT